MSGLSVPGAAAGGVRKEAIFGGRGWGWGGWGRRIRGFDGRGGVGGGFEFFEDLESAEDGAAGGIEAVLEFGEGARVAGRGISEGGLLRVAEFVVALVLPHLGFGGVEAAEGPLAADQVVDEEAAFGGSGAVALVILVDELFEVGTLLGAKDEGFGTYAGFEGVHGGGGLACDRGWAGRLFGITAVGFYLADGRHLWLRSELRSDGQAGGLSHFEDRGEISGIRGWVSVSYWK